MSDREAKRIADHVFHELRQRLGLWFDLNECAATPNCVGESQLTDGSTYLLLWASDHPIDPENSIRVSVPEDVEFFLSWMNRHDSIRTFTRVEISAIVDDALARLPLESEDSYLKLASFELRGAIDLDDTMNWFCNQLPNGSYSDLPSYSGKAISELEGPIPVDPRIRWFQLEFDPRLRVTEFVHSLSHSLIGFETFQAGKAFSFGTRGYLREANVKKVCIVGREF